MKMYQALKISVLTFCSADVIRTSGITQDGYDWLSNELNEDGTFKS